MAERLLDPEQQGAARELFAQINHHDREEFREGYYDFVAGIKRNVAERVLQIQQLGIFPNGRFVVLDEQGEPQFVEKPAIYIIDVASSFDDDHVVITPEGLSVVGKLSMIGDERLFGTSSRQLRADEVVLYANYAYTAMEGLIMRALGASNHQEVLNGTPN